MRPSAFTPSDERLFEIDAAIERHGVSYTCVLGDQFHPHYQYSIGFLLQGHPELTTIGLTPESGAGLIQHFFERVVDGERFDQGAEIDHHLHGRRARFLDVPTEHVVAPGCLLAGIPHYFGSTTGALPDRAALQLVWSDGDGRYPWDDDVDPLVRRDQPVLAHGDAARRRTPLPAPVDNSCACRECRREAARAATRRARRRR